MHCDCFEDVLEIQLPSRAHCTVSEPKRRQVPRGFWTKIENQRQFFEATLAEILSEKRLALSSIEEQLDVWYTVTTPQIRNRGGNAILNLYGGSLAAALQVGYGGSLWFL